MTHSADHDSRPWEQTYRLPGETVFAGEYPGDWDPANARRKLASLLDHGVRAFVDLTREEDGLVPYADLLHALAAERAVEVRYHPMPVQDMGVPDHPAQMQAILDLIEAEAGAGHGVYVHCWGGIGRTGTAVACFLIRRGLTAEAALDRVQQLYSTMPKSRGAFPHSPQTDVQRAFVRTWQGVPTGATQSAGFSIDAAELLQRHPPQFKDDHKRALVQRMLDGPPAQGVVHVTQWAEGVCADALPADAPEIELREGFFRYDPSDAAPGETHWHVNFADADLFGYYGGNLLAQDELQVLEHPALGAVREWLLAIGGPHRTISRAGAPTPMLVAGVERRGAFATMLPTAAGPPINLYGNHFSGAPRASLQQALQVLQPPTASNVIAIAARGHGVGRYTHDAIDWTLRMAAIGFEAACRESRRLAGAHERTVVHTGWWGCGAFGGDRELMAVLQFVAAHLTGVHRVVFHRGFDDADRTAERARARWLSHYRTAGSRDAAVQALFDAGYRWGVGNGT